MVDPIFPRFFGKHHTIHDGIAEKRIPVSIAKESVGKILGQQLLVERGQLDYSSEESLAIDYTIDDLDKDVFLLPQNMKK